MWPLIKINHNDFLLSVLIAPTPPGSPERKEVRLPGARLAVVSAEVRVRRRRRRRAVGDRGGGGRRSPVAAARTVVGPRSRHGVHRADAGAGRDLAVAGVRQVVRFAGGEEGVTWRRGEQGNG